MNNWTKGYKAFNKVHGNNKSGECRGFVFEEGKTYKIDGELKICSNGFHACKDIVLTLEYYPDVENNVYAEIEFIGDVVYEEPTKHKGASNKIKILKFIDINSFFKDSKKNSGHNNSGHSNSGGWNSGGWNSGHRNSGDSNSGGSNSGDWNSGGSNSGNWNSGHSNSGDWNSGNWNSCNNESGFFNSKQSEYINVFNKKCLRSYWDDSQKPSFIYFEIKPELGYKGSFQESFIKASKEDIELLKALPNFDEDVFFEISGIRIK